MKQIGVVLVLAAIAVGLGVAISNQSSNSSASTAGPPALSSGAQPIVYVPAHLRAGRVPLLIALHGTGGTPATVQATTGFDTLADRHGFIVAYLGSRSPLDNWILPSETNYIRSMIDQLERAQPIDPARVYVTGFSAGGYQAYKSGCVLSNKVAAVAPVGVSMNAVLYQTCKLSRPVSTLIIIGSADLAHYGGYGGLPSAPAAAARWRALDGCRRPRPESTRAPGPTNDQLWTGCSDGSAVGLNTVVGGSHAYPNPGLGSSTPDGRYDASAAIWAFLAAHRAGSLHAPDARATSLVVVVRRGAREVVLTLRLGEPVTVKDLVARHGRTVASKRASVPRGNRVRVVTAVPRRVGGGRYSVRLVVTDSYGRTFKLTRRIRLPTAPG